MFPSCCFPSDKHQTIFEPSHSSASNADETISFPLAITHHRFLRHHRSDESTAASTATLTPEDVLRPPHTYTLLPSSSSRRTLAQDFFRARWPNSTRGSSQLRRAHVSFFSFFPSLKFMHSIQGLSFADFRDLRVKYLLSPILPSLTSTLGRPGSSIATHLTLMCGSHLR